MTPDNLYRIHGHALLSIRRYVVAWRVEVGGGRLEVIERAGGNKDEGIGVGGWTIRRGYPMKPSAVQGIVDIPYHGQVLLEMARGKSEPTTKGQVGWKKEREEWMRESGTVASREERAKGSVCAPWAAALQDRLQGEIIRWIDGGIGLSIKGCPLDRSRKNNAKPLAMRTLPMELGRSTRFFEELVMQRG